MSADGVDKGAEERPSSDLNKWDSWFNLSDDDSDIHVHVDTECESSSTETSELMTNYNFRFFYLNSCFQLYYCIQMYDVM